jgi:VRR-NUC domain
VGKRRNPERTLHIQVADYLAAALPSDAVPTCFPAGGGGAIRGALLKRMGLMAGFPDILIIWRGHPILIELKDAAKGRLSPAQIIAHHRLRNAGAAIGVCRSVAEVAEWLEFIGVPLKAKIAA